MRRSLLVWENDFVEQGKKGGLGIALMLVCAACLCTGQFVWKYYNGLLPLAIGLGIYGLGALAMLSAYRFGSLSVLQPVNSVSYVIATIFGSVFFHEPITAGKVLGIALIMLGAFLLARGEVAE